MVRGGDDNLWTESGLPNEITVNMTVEDLYPQLFLSQTLTHLKYNWSMMVLLDSLAGTSYETITGTFVNKIKYKINVEASEFRNLINFTTLRADVQDKLSTVATWIGRK